MVVKHRIEPSKEDMDAARKIRDAMQAARKRAPGGALRLAGVELSAATRVALDRVLEEFAKGNAVVVEGSRDGSEYTTTRAAAELGMSRPTLINLLEEGKMSYRMVGTHRRVLRTEVERYKRTMSRGGEAVSGRLRTTALGEMAKTTASMDEGY